MSVSLLKEFLEISPLSPCNDTLEATSFSDSYYVSFPLKKKTIIPSLSGGNIFPFFYFSP